MTETILDFGLGLGFIRTRRGYMFLVTSIISPVFVKPYKAAQAWIVPKLICALALGMAVYCAYAWVQVRQLGRTSPTYDIYDSDNYPLVCLNDTDTFHPQCPPSTTT